MTCLDPGAGPGPDPVTTFYKTAIFSKLSSLSQSGKETFR